MTAVKKSKSSRSSRNTANSRSPRSTSPKTDAKQTIDEALSCAVVCHRAGHLHQAAALYEAVLKVQPRHADANHNLGLLRVQAQQPDAGLPYFLAAIEAEPTISQYWQSYIEGLLLAGQGDDARLVFEHARQHGLQGPGINELGMKLSSAA